MQNKGWCVHVHGRVCVCVGYVKDKHKDEEGPGGINNTFHGVIVIHY